MGATAEFPEHQVKDSFPLTLEREMTSLTLTAEFRLFSDDTRLGPRFTHSSYEFRDLGAPDSFVNISGSVKGLQFPDAGMEVKLPLPHENVSIRAAALHTRFSIAGKDSAGAVLVRATVPNDNQPHDIQLTHPGIAFVEFTGGGNEGTLESISITVFGCTGRAG